MAAEKFQAPLQATRRGGILGQIPLRTGLFGLAAFGSLLISGILQTGLVPQELSAIFEEFELDEQKFGILASSIAVMATILGLYL